MEPLITAYELNVKADFFFFFGTKSLVLTPKITMFFFNGSEDRLDFSLTALLPFRPFYLEVSDGMLKPSGLHQNSTPSPYGKTLIDRLQEEHMFMCHRQKLLRP